jgi:arginine decarboxylase
VTEVLGFTQYDERSLMRKMKRQIDQATKEDLIKPRDGIKILDIYSQLLSAQTYLKD